MKREWFRRYWYWVVIAVIIVTAGALISAFRSYDVCDKIITFFDDWSVALSAAAAVILAVAAFLTIRHSNEREKRRREEELLKEKRDREERLLNEIIEWAIDVAKPKYALNLMRLTSSTISEKDQTTALQLGWASDTDILIVRGDYIDKIALIFTHDLRIAVEKVRHDLENHAKLINALIDGKDTSKEIGKHQYALGRAANKVIEEATKIKTREMS